MLGDTSAVLVIQLFHIHDHGIPFGIGTIDGIGLCRGAQRSMGNDDKGAVR
jgi:hypothetical protein